MLDHTQPPRARLLLLVSGMLLWSCSGVNTTGIAGASDPTATSALIVTSSELPNGQVGRAYSAKLTAIGSSSALSWQLTAGALPAGLALQGPSGLIAGVPTQTAPGTALTFQVSDSGSPTHTQSVSLKLNVSPAEISVAITPRRAGLTVTQPLALTASTSDVAGVNWSVAPAGGSFSRATGPNGSTVTFAAPSLAGVYTITATSVTDPAQSASIAVGVTDLAGVYTYHNDLARDGANTREFALTPASVNTATFGKLFSCSVDGAVYAQPLWAANLSVGGARRNVVFVATAHDGLFAFDADASPCTQLWRANLIDRHHGANSGEVPVPAGTTGYFVGQGDGDMTPEVGVTGTPVIDPLSATLYVVSKSMNSAGTSFYQRLHAIDIITGNERPGSPVLIAASYLAGWSSSVAFSAQQQNQRAGLALVNGVVYICWGAHEDSVPWWGWIMGYTYNGAAFTQASVFNSTPNASFGGGIWMGGGAPAADGNGHLYVLTGNGAFDAANSSGFNNDYGDSFLQLDRTLGVSSWFTPSDQAVEAMGDGDLGSGGAAVVLNLSSGPLRHLVVGGGKEGTLYVLNGDYMGGLGDASARQNFPVGQGTFHGIFATPAFWNNTLYVASVTQPMLAFAFDGSTDLFNPTPTSQSPTTYGFPGSGPSVSASGASSDGIVWGLESTNYCTNQAKGCGPAVLHAYDASNLASELWNSSMVGADAAGNAVKFTVPTVANGRVYIGTRGNNKGGLSGSTSVDGELDVYGLKPD